MPRVPHSAELGLFRVTGKRQQPRDARGRFVRVRYSAQRLKVLAVARAMRVRLGLPSSPYLLPFGMTEAGCAGETEIEIAALNCGSVQSHA